MLIKGVFWLAGRKMSINQFGGEVHVLPAAKTPATGGNQPVVSDTLGEEVRRLRTVKGWGLAALAAAAHCDRGYLSRVERGLRRPSQTVVAALDTALDVNGRLLALAREGDDMRRRTVLTGASAVAAAVLVPSPAAATAGGLGEVLFASRPEVGPVGVGQLRAAVTAATAEFHQVRYGELARRLPGLVRAVEATRDAAVSDDPAQVEGVLATVYGVAANLAVKLHETGLAWSMTDRAVQTARAAGNPRALAEAHRTAAVVLRRSGQHDEARRVIVTAATGLRADTRLADGRDRSLYASMLATAAYTAALADRRDDAWTLAGEAGAALASGRQIGFGRNDLELYRSGIARALGDYGQAVDHARQVRLDLCATPERRARYWEDTALAWMGRGRPTQAWEALREAEAAAPQEVLYRPWAQQLTATLLAADVRGGLPGLRSFAARVGVPGAAR
ncbi:hypothetical protein C5N14_28210 [Micromonospora sp. MW-13]|uniref:helix-turn-helix domain-containing protein n=1 Tax=Micromonospora sp. MW-13 TaxID=2094022 RepID=UPI000E4387C8|nr:helix-turn-helix transcriptional regulator [Micromonospora sp. MW-13]RGC65490.1 hypothetical protein C5N14_28210 [Micromonospora sp. MW-13]